MSAICGIVDYSRRGLAIDAELKCLIAPLWHSQAFTIEKKILDDAGLARVFFDTRDNFCSASRNLIDDEICFVSGYITNIAQWTDEISRDSGGEVKVTSAADILAYIHIVQQGKGMERLNGIFSFALWRPSRNELILGTDRHGIRPLYYRQFAGHLVFASEMKAIYNSGDSYEIDDLTAEEILVLGFPLGDNTLLKDAKRVPSGSFIRFRSEGPSTTRYWWYDQWKVDSTLTPQDYISENIRLLKQSIGRLDELSDKPICLLSSGLDSRRIMLELTRTGKQPEIFTTALQLAGAHYDTDSIVTQELCREFSLKQTLVDIYPAELEGELARHAFHLLDYETSQHRWLLPLLSKIPQNAGVNFDGLGGDMLVYDDHVTPEINQECHNSNKLASTILDMFGAPIRLYLRKAPSGPPLIERVAAMLDNLPQNANRFTTFQFSNWTRRRTSLFGQTLLSMKVESVCPYFDNDLADFCMSLSPSLKLDRNYQDEILRFERADLMKRIPTSHYPFIRVSPDEFSRPFTRPLPKQYGSIRKRHLYGAAAKEIFAAPRLLSILSANSLLVTLSTLGFNTVNMMPKEVVSRGWRLEPLMQLALFKQSLHDKTWREEALTKARESVYG
ncbi:MAG: asparagine synthase-related protein [candidate division Zixibacteria bacterium]|nr:asparagine synthase-related protein [candidate division Zixibacteria bacterium]